MTKVLVVDDDMRNQSIMNLAIEDNGYQLKSAMNGKEALVQMKEFSPDIVLLDIMMPDMDGYEVCKVLRSKDEYEHVRVIMVSGKAYPSDRADGYKAGADDYLTKPLNVFELLLKLKSFSRLISLEREIGKVRGQLDKIKLCVQQYCDETKAKDNGVLQQELMQLLTDS